MRLALLVLLLSAPACERVEESERSRFALTISNGTLRLNVGESVRLMVTPTDATGAPFTDVYTVSWQSSATTIASVSADGVVSGLAQGAAEVTAVATRLDTGATATARANVVVVSSGAGGGTVGGGTVGGGTVGGGTVGGGTVGGGTVGGGTVGGGTVGGGTVGGGTVGGGMVGGGTVGGGSAGGTTVSGLVAAYGFSAGTGTSVVDASGRGRAGTFMSSPAPSWVPGKNGGGLGFSGTGGYVTMGDVDALDGLSQLTVEAWIKTTASGEKHIVDKSGCDGAAGGGPFEFGVGFFTSGRATMLVYGAAGYFMVESAMSVNDGAWHHLAGVFDGARLQMFVDGAVAGTANVPLTSLNANTNALELGGHCNGYAYPWNGTVDDVRLFSRALTASDIAADAASPVVDPPTGGGASGGGASGGGAAGGMATGGGTSSGGGVAGGNAGGGTSTGPTYSLNFATAAIENPLSAGGVWTNNTQGTGGNGAPGNMTSMQVGLASDGVTRIAHATLMGVPNYDDSFAFVPGFPGDQFAEAVVYRAPGYNPSANHEIELHLGCSSSPGIHAWNEFLVSSAGNVQLFLIDGAPNAFTPLPTMQYVSNTILADGDVLRATRVGNVLSLYVNGTLWLRHDGSSPGLVAHGSGIGFGAYLWPGAQSNSYGFRSIRMGSL